MVVLLQAKEVIDLLSVENVTVFGIMSFVIILLIRDREILAKKTEREHDKLHELIKDIREQRDKEYKSTNQDFGTLLEKYHVFTAKVLFILNRKDE